MYWLMQDLCHQQYFGALIGGILFFWVHVGEIPIPPNPKTQRATTAGPSHANSKPGTYIGGFTGASGDLRAWTFRKPHKWGITCNLSYADSPKYPRPPSRRIHARVGGDLCAWTFQRPPPRPVGSGSGGGAIVTCSDLRLGCVCGKP